jgi:serralysin
VRRAFDYLSSIINVTFTESNSAGQADINFGTNNQSTKGSSGYANVPNGSGDHPVYLFLDNSPGNANTTMTQGSYGWETLIHEIGHTLGLKHPGNYNASGGVMPGPYLPKALDSRLYTLMSYNNPTGSLEVSSASLPSGATRYSASTVNPSTYMMFDMAALQFMYGVGNGQGTSDYQVTSFTADWSGMQTLWMPEDGVIDASAVSNANIIDLRAGAFSSINVIPKSITDSFPASLKTAATYMGLNNVGLAYGSQVSTAKGGTAGDVFYTSTAADVSIDGGAGSDTVYLAGSAADWVQNQGIYTNAKLARSVSLSNVEVVKYYNADLFATTHSRLDLQA